MPARQRRRRRAPRLRELGYGPGYKLPGLPHRTGHGIGLDGHEPLYLVHGDATPLAPGMCFSDEPGIYIPGKFGVRIEDCWHMTAAGPKFSPSRRPVSTGRLRESGRTELIWESCCEEHDCRSSRVGRADHLLFRGGPVRARLRPLAAPAQAQNDKMAPIPTPVQADAIVLGTGPLPDTAAPESRHPSDHRAFARNVTVATLTLFLPDPSKATGTAVIVAPGGGFRCCQWRMKDRTLPVLSRTEA